MRSLLLVGAATLLAASGWAQSVISARSGTIQYTEGSVTVNDQAVQVNHNDTKFPVVDIGQTLATQDGRVEVLLTPPVFMRLAENSSIRMVANKLVDTRVEVLSGSAMVEAGRFLQDNSVTLMYKGADIALTRSGLYRIDSDRDTLRVYDGEARVSVGGDTTTATRGEAVQLGAVLAKSKFDPKIGDDFYRWNARRDEYVAEANVYAAHQAQGMGSNYSGDTWLYNPYFGMYTFAPMAGMYFSPFGYGYFSPFAVGALYMPGYFGYFGYPYMGYYGGVSYVPTYTRSLTSGTTPISSSVSHPVNGAFAARPGGLASPSVSRVGSSGSNSGGLSSASASSAHAGAMTGSHAAGGHR